jgi:hypothetical protein
MISTSTLRNDCRLYPSCDDAAADRVRVRERGGAGRLLDQLPPRPINDRMAWRSLGWWYPRR